MNDFEVSDDEEYNANRLPIDKLQEFIHRHTIDQKLKHSMYKYEQRKLNWVKRVYIFFIQRIKCLRQSSNLILKKIGKSLKN